MFLRLLFAFTVIPLVELWLLVAIGREVGLLPTIAVVLATGVAGAYLARQQGLRTLERLRLEWSAGRVPTEALLDGALILVAGAVLLTPGILTDAFGFVLLVPATRRAVRRGLGAWLRRRMARRGDGQRGRVIVVDRVAGGDGRDDGRPSP